MQKVPDRLITVGFTPKFVIIFGKEHTAGSTGNYMYFGNDTYYMKFGTTGFYVNGEFASDRKDIFNVAGQIYNYLAIG